MVSGSKINLVSPLSDWWFLTVVLFSIATHPLSPLLLFRLTHPFTVSSQLVCFPIWPDPLRKIFSDNNKNESFSYMGCWITCIRTPNCYPPWIFCLIKDFFHSFLLCGLQFTGTLRNWNGEKELPKPLSVLEHLATNYSWGVPTIWKLDLSWLTVSLSVWLFMVHFLP